LNSYCHSLFLCLFCISYNSKYWSCRKVL
jgi:hypothetical protein